MTSIQNQGCTLNPHSRRTLVAILAVTIVTFIMGCTRETPLPTSIAHSNYHSPDTSLTTDSSPSNFPLGKYAYPASGVALGQGWNSFLEQGTAATCVSVQEVSLERTTFQSTVQQIQSSYSLSSRRSSSVSASYRGYGAKASASLSTSSSRDINTDDQNFLFEYESYDGSTFALPAGVVPMSNFEYTDSQIKAFELAKSPAAQQSLVQAVSAHPALISTANFQLSEYAQKLLAEGVEPFRQACGDGFVSAIHRGTRIQVLLTQKFASRESRDSLAASLAASGYGGAVNASQTRSSDEFKSIDELSYQTFQEGGLPRTPVALNRNPKDRGSQPFDVNQILPTAEQLVSNPTAFEVTVTPYANLDLGVPVTLPTPTQLTSLSDYYLALRDLYTLVQDVLSSEREGRNGKPESAVYDPSLIRAYGGVNAMIQLADAIHADLAILESAIDSCYRHASNCTVEESMKVVRQEMLEASDDTAKLIAELGTKMNAEEKESKAKAEMTENIARLEAVKKSADEFAHLISERGDLDQDFFYSFYVYLTQIPIPRSAYKGVAGLELLADPKVLPGDAALTNSIAEFRSELAKAVVEFRIEPWRKFFCRAQMSAALCIPDSSVDLLVNTSAYRIDAKTFLTQALELQPIHIRNRPGISIPLTPIPGGPSIRLPRHLPHF